MNDLSEQLERVNARLTRLGEKLTRRARREPWLTIVSCFIGYLGAMFAWKVLSW